MKRPQRWLFLNHKESYIKPAKQDRPKSMGEGGESRNGLQLHVLSLDLREG